MQRVKTSTTLGQWSMMMGGEAYLKRGSGVVKTMDIIDVEG